MTTSTEKIKGVTSDEYFNLASYSYKHFKVHVVGNNSLWHSRTTSRDLLANVSTDNQYFWCFKRYHKIH